MASADSKEQLIEEKLTFSHKFCLEPPYPLTCVGENLCNLLGYTEEEIRDQFQNLYTPMVHPEDQARFLQYIALLASREQTLALRYRMVKKNGDLIYINDIMFSHKKKDGKMYGFSVIVDITKNIQYHSAYSMFNLSSAVPFAYLQCTCERFPRVLCVNDMMMNYLNISKDSRDWTEFLHDNIFFMIPFEEREQFRNCLDEALTKKEPIKIQHEIIRSDGTRVHVTGWLGTILNQQKEKEFSIVYTEMSNQAAAASLPDNSYFRALEGAYNIIFELNLTRKTVECVYGKETSDLGRLYDVRMTLDSAASFWLNNYIVEEDRPRMKAYFDTICTPGAVAASIEPMQTEFRIAWDDHAVYSFVAVTVAMGVGTLLFCLRDTAKVQYSSLQAREIRAMKKLHHYMDLMIGEDQGTVGTILFEKQTNGRYALIHASTSILDLLCIRHDQYLHYVVDGFQVEDVQDKAAQIGLEDLKGLMAGKSLEYVSKNQEHFQLSCQKQTEFVWKLVASKDIPQSGAGVPNEGIFARTFGFFDLFVNRSPVIFSNHKEKELMALLIDRNGGTLTPTDAIGYLWENETLDERLKARFRKLAMGLKKTLQNYGIEHILINNNGVRSIDTSALTCDYYELLAGNAQYVRAFHNSYMSEYSWSERTLATLWDFS